jgi:serpin B
MQRHKFTGVKENFLQRRYGVSLGRRYVVAAASVVLLGVLGCSSVGGGTKTQPDSRLPGSESPVTKKAVKPDTKIINANNKFGFKLLAEIHKQNSSQKNIFISPSSVAIALAMTYNGASGSTQQAMAKALELQGMKLTAINSANLALKQLLETSDNQVQINIANSLWANKDITFQPDFIQRVQASYKAKVTNLDFQDTAKSLTTINNWVNEQTKGKIPKIVETIQPNQALFLINTLYFNGKWSEAFNKNQTATHPFYLSDGKPKPHPMMSQKGEYKYLETEQFQAVSIPYGAGKFSFYIFLPKQNSNLKAFEQNLNAETWEKWISQFSQQKGFIRLPKFKTDYEVTLNDALKALGMTEAFTNQANFTAMGKNFTISQVKHKTVVEVNEEGTEAAAATSAEIVTTSLRQEEKPFQMIVDRPFFCAIRDQQTGTILFMGTIFEPQ